MLTAYPCIGERRKNKQKKLKQGIGNAQENVKLRWKGSFKNWPLSKMATGLNSQLLNSFRADRSPHFDSRHLKFKVNSEHINESELISLEVRAALCKIHSKDHFAKATANFCDHKLIAYSTEYSLTNYIIHVLLSSLIPSNVRGGAWQSLLAKVCLLGVQ